MDSYRRRRSDFRALIWAALLFAAATPVWGQGGATLPRLRPISTTPELPRCLDSCDPAAKSPIAECVTRPAAQARVFAIEKGFSEEYLRELECVTPLSARGYALRSKGPASFGYGGAALGGLIGAALGAAVGYRLCQEQSDIMICLPVLPVAGGLVMGALIGGLIDR